MDDDCDENDDTKRRSRNLSEKKRRDQFNMLVSELSTLVTSNNRKMDKSTVLKSTLLFLKNHNEVTVRSRVYDVKEDWKPAFLTNEEFTYLVLEALEGFVMVFSVSGTICYVSESITSLLGHNSVDIINKSIFDLTFEEDQPNLYNLLQSTATAMEQMPNSSKENETIRFQIHLRRGMLDREDVTYDLVQFYGHFRSNREQACEDRDMMGYQYDNESRCLFVCIGRLHPPQLIRNVSLLDSSRSEFSSRHSLEWKFLFLDHRAPPIIGYLPFEVLGTSGYDYYHFDDLEKVVTCHEALMQKGELTSCFYRFLTKGQEWIWLQSRFYITYHQWNSKPEFVVCTHRVVSYDDTIKQESVELDADVSESKVNQDVNLKDTPSDGRPPAMSPSYMSEAASDSYANSYHPDSQRMSPQCEGAMRVVSRGPATPLTRVLDRLPLKCPRPMRLPCSCPRSPSSPIESEQTLSPLQNPLLPVISPPNVAYPIFHPNYTYPPMFQPNIAQPVIAPPIITQPVLSPVEIIPIGITPSSASLPPIPPLYVPLPTVSPSYTAETATDDFGNSFQLVSQNALRTPSPDTMGLSPWCNESSDSFACQSYSQTFLKTPLYEGRQSVSPNLSNRSDSYVDFQSPISVRDYNKLSASKYQPQLSQSNLTELYVNPETTQKHIYGPLYPSSAFVPTYSKAACAGYENDCLSVQPASVKSASAGSTTGTSTTAATTATGASWAQVPRYTCGSDTASQSGESFTSQRNTDRESNKPRESCLAPQHGMGAQYLDPPTYDAAEPADALVPLSTMPALGAADHAQIQEQLQKKHEELQQMIIRQQEELHQVKEQLLLARLGILQPVINVPNPYSTPEEMQNQQRITQLSYMDAAPRAELTAYPHGGPLLSQPPHASYPQHQLHQPNQLHPPHPSLSPDPSEPHQHMPK